MRAEWKVWDQNKSYGEVLYKRAVGELPEMESSKRIAKEVKKFAISGSTILDVGCGAGHYLRSLRRELGDSFSYVGCDATEHYIALAKKAFAADKNAAFQVSDIFGLDFDDNSFDLVICNNLLLHLPSIDRPVNELIRVARRRVIIRTLCGERSFRIQDVRPQTDGREFSREGDPVAFYYYNIYSRDYMTYVLSSNPKAKSWEIAADTDFDKARIEESARDHAANNATQIVGDYQVNGYILQPWAIVTILL
jgi:ubiquinone/menaquinone biosynthesis C-methylase UbiE